MCIAGVPPSATLAVGQLLRGDVLAVAEEQRRLHHVVEALHAPDEDDVIAAFVAVFDAAFEVRRGAADQRNAVLAERELDAGELVGVRLREASRELAVLAAEDADAERGRLAERGVAAGAAREAPQHERRVERNGAERV